MLGILLVLGFLIGSALAPSLAVSEFSDDRFIPGFAFDPTAGILGMIIAFVLWSAQASIAYFQGDSILLAVSRAKPLEKSDNPRLFNVVEEMSIAASLPKMPKIYLIDDMAMNAFATGRKPENAAVAVTAGLLGRMNRDQLQGVVAHEISHIVNRDVLFMTMVGIMVGSIVMISELFLRSLRFGASTPRYRGGDRKGNGGQMVVLVIAIVFAIVAPLLAQLIYFAVSRKREYLADAGSAVYTRYPEGLASALEVLSGDTAVLQSANRVTAPMFIINPLHQEGGLALNLTRTHPPLEDRVRVLRGLTGGVSYAQYQQAMQKTGARNAAHIPQSGLQQPALAIRGPHPETQEEGSRDAAQRMREAGDLLRKVNQFVFLQCVCGMKVKLPPDFKKESVDCPRCQRHLQVPVAQLAAVAGAGELLGAQSPGAIPYATPKAPPKPARADEAPLRVQRQPSAWTSVKCSCGAIKNIAPSFALGQTQCSQCGRTMIVE